MRSAPGCHSTKKDLVVFHCIARDWVKRGILDVMYYVCMRLQDSIDRYVTAATSSCRGDLVGARDRF